MSDSASPSPDDADDRLEDILRRANQGDPEAQARFFEIVYEELRRMAQRALAKERDGHTLQATAIVHELWLRLLGGKDRFWNDRNHFMRTAARAIRRVLIDYARRGDAGRRIPRHKIVPLAEAFEEFDRRALGKLEDLDDLLIELGEVDPQLEEFTVLRFFGGYTIAQASELLGIDEAQGRKNWKFVKAWLKERLRGDDEGDAASVPV